MKKLIITIFSVCVLLSVGAMTAFAADTSEQPKKNVTITVVLPEPSATPEIPTEPTPATTVKPISNLYPSDVTEIKDGKMWNITKTYELGASDNPAEIPRVDFERSGYKFTLTDIIKKETANAETRDHKETITLNTDTKDLEKIMPLLSQTMEYKTEDGFVGLLTLDVASIKVETAGTKTTSYTLSVTREYPNLSTNDSELVPKTVTDKGKTYYLAGVEWKVGNYSTIDYERIPDYYNAVATYTATGSSTKVTGYITTAEYNGTLAKMAQGKTVYTAYFEGTEIRTPLETVDSNPASVPNDLPDTTGKPTEQTTETPTDELTETSASGGEKENADNEPNNSVFYVIIAVLAAMCGALFYLYNKNRRNTDYAKTHYTSSRSDDDGGDVG